MLKVVLDDYAGVARSPWQTGRLRRNSKIVILPAHDMPHVFSWAQRQRFASARQRLKATGWRSKGVDRAIRIAQHCGVPLKIAAKVDNVDRKYFEEQIRPMMKTANVEYIGEIDDTQKSEFLSGAIALLVPIDWPEPFGLVMIEAMACGTPVIAFDSGSVPEVMEDGLTGFVVNDIDEAVAAVGVQ